MKRPVTPPERRKKRGNGGAGCLLRLFLIVIAAGIFLLRWLWQLGRAERPARRAPRSASLGPAGREALASATARESRESIHLRRVDWLVVGIILLSVALVPLLIWGLPDWLTELPTFIYEPAGVEASWLQDGRAWAPDEATQDALRATERAQLSSYGWRDEDAGVARIPIERAMRLVIEEGEWLAMAPLPAAATPAATGVVTATATVASVAGRVQAGERLFGSLGCADCHVPDGSGVGPSLAGLLGSEVQLENGETVRASAAYVRRSILQPQEQIVAGYQPIMPSFGDELSEQQLQDLLAYIRSLSEAEEP